MTARPPRTFNQATTGSLGTTSHTYADGPATRTVTVTVTDKDTRQSTRTTFTVTVANVAPTVAFWPARLTVNEGAAEHTYSYTITDPGDDTVSSSRPAAAPTASRSAGSDPTATSRGSFNCTFPDGPASSTVTVQATDLDNAAGNTASRPVTVANVKPTVTITSLTGNSGTACLSGNTVTLGFSWTDPAGTNDTYGYDVNWGDGNHTIVAAVPGVARR